MRIPLLISLFTLAACGGGGSGGPGTAPPVLASAAFVGAGSAPVAGDQLLLFLSDDVRVVAGALLTDEDVSLSAGSLGSISNPPVLLSARVVQVTLGAGVTFTPDVDTIDFSALNDAIESTSGGLAIPGTDSVIRTGDGDNPTISSLTLNAIDSELNGTGPAGGTLQVPRNGFTIEIAYTDPSSPIDVSATTIDADVSVTTPGGTLVPGQNFASQLTATTGTGSTSFLVPSTVTFADGPVTITAHVVDVTGMASGPATFSFNVRNLDDGVRPFETSVNPTQVWYLDLTRDIESYTHNTGAPFNPVQITDTPNGRPDLEDLFLILGLHGSSGSVNATVTGQFETRLLAELATLFTGIKVSFTLTSPGTFPGTTTPYNSLGFSQICIAGSEDTSGTSGVLGVAIFDPRNEGQDNNCLLNFAGSQRLGVFVHTLVNFGMIPPSTTLFRTTFDPFTPGFSGFPIGDHPDGQDAQRLSGAVTDGRATEISNAIQRLARSTAVITAHECGHSMGLVEDDPMPNGLYGGDGTNFPGSTTGHIRNSSLFPSGSQNVMSPALSFDATLSNQTNFNTLNRAYLLERAIYN